MLRALTLRLRSLAQPVLRPSMRRTKDISEFARRTVNGITRIYKENKMQSCNWLSGSEANGSAEEKLSVCQFFFLFVYTIT